MTCLMRLPSERLTALGITGGEAFWMAVRGNCEKVEDAKLYWQTVEGPVEGLIEDEDRDYVSKARDLLPDGDVTAETWGAWTQALKAETGRKGRGLFMPLRRVLTGLDHGPDMKEMLPLIGRQNILDRLP